MTSESLLEFPCQFPLKVMGKDNPEFRTLIIEIVARHIDKPPSPEPRPSNNAQYVSLSFHLQVESREQLDNLYRELSQHEQVLFVI